MTSATQQIVSTEYSHLLWEDEAVMMQDQMMIDPATGQVIKRRKVNNDSQTNHSVYSLFTHTSLVIGQTSAQKNYSLV